MNIKIRGFTILGITPLLEIPVEAKKDHFYRNAIHDYH
jgi:hypothetical protein